MAARHSRVLHRSLREQPPKAVGGDGVWLIAEDGRRILDGSGGAAVSTATLNTWQGAMRSGVPNIGLPPGYSTTRGAAQGYWANADIRLVLDLNSSNDYGQKATSGGSTISASDSPSTRRSRNGRRAPRKWSARRNN
jgi:hypothetical protein